MKRSFASAAASALACLTIAAAPAAHADAVSDFYAYPASVTSTPGTLISSAPMETLLNVWGKTTRIKYSSTDNHGNPVAVTGAYIEPWASWQGPGQRPVVAFASGTIGQGDQCAPSKMLTSIIGLSGGSLSFNYETLAMNNLLSKGVAVVVTDYIGLGSDERVHTYVDRLDQGRALLDAARAAKSVPGGSVKADSKVATYGYSQGGGAAASAAELQPTYAPDLDLTAAYAGAPPADLLAVLKGIDGSTIAGAVGYYLNGAKQSYPQINTFLDQNLNDAGKAMMNKVSTQCIADTGLTYPFAQSKNWMKSGLPLGTLVDNNPTFESVVEAQRIGRLKPTAAVRVATGTQDDIIPHAQVKTLAKDWCKLGANVTYAPIPTINLIDKTALNHIAPMLKDAGTARDWIVDRLAGKEATNNCSSIDSMA